MQVSVMDNGEVLFRPPRPGLTTVVLLPGLIAGSWMWQSTMDMLGAEGYGYLALAEPFAARHSQISPLKHRVTDLMDRYGIKRAVMAGGSFGSRVALECALEFPERVEMLVLSGAPASITTQQLGITFQGKATDRIARTLVERLFFDPRCVSEQNISAALEIFRNGRCLLNAIRLMKESDSLDVAHVLGRIKAFVLIVWGMQDQISSCEVWERLAQTARAGAFFKLDHCGHTPMIERPDLFNQIMLDYLPEARVARRLA